MHIHLGAPQLVYLALSIFALGIGIAKHGEKKTGEHNFVTDLIAIFLQSLLMYWGGFFN